MIERYSRPEMTALWTDQHRFETMLEVEILACEAMSKQGLVPKSAISKMRRLCKVNVPRIRKIEAVTKHDVIAFVSQVGEKLGKDSRYIHMGLTSNDVLDTALSVQLKEATVLLMQGVRELRSTVGKLARKHENTLMMGRSHGIHAEPITFGFKLAGWYTELARAEERLKRAESVIAMGKLSGAVGTFAHNDPFVESYVCRKLGLKPEPAATQIIPRDRHAEYLSHLAVIASSLERFAVEIRHLQRTEVLEAEEPFSKGQKGSSAMPHKKNPIQSENLCGLARLVRAYAVAELESVALWHERDISHSSVERVALPDATILLDFMLHRLNGVVAGLVVHPENMKRNMTHTLDLVCTQRVLLALVSAGWKRDDGYARVQKLALQAWNSRRRFKDLVFEDPGIVSAIGAKALEKCFDAGYFVRRIGGVLRRSGLLRH